jgi:arylsulfatase K
MTQRNIIFFHTESWNGRMLGNLGHPALANATPNVDRIAKAGTQFTQTYCSHPICCPSRANMWSGRYTPHCESWNNHKGLEPGMWSLLAELPKTHVFTHLGKLDYMSGGHTPLARLSAWLCASGVQRPVFDHDPAQEAVPRDDDHMRNWTGDWNKVDAAIDFMKQARHGERPFFLYVSTGLAHTSTNTNQYWLDKIPEDMVDIPPQDQNDHPARRYQQIAKAWRKGFDDDTVRRVRRSYMAKCAEADAMVGAVYDAMHELGLADDTYFVFSSDHGEMGMEHQDWSKMSLYEASVRVPLVMTGPDIAVNQRINSLVSVIDLCPTFLAMMGVEPRTGLDGQSLLPTAMGQPATLRDSAFACHTGCTLNTSAFMLRKEQWKYVFYTGFAPQLFDLENDPDELIDLAADHPDVIQRLDQELNSIVDCQKVHHDWQNYCKNAFTQWRRQAKRGLYVDNSYSLRNNPSSDYWAIMGNCFTGYDQSDEEKVNQWLKSK